MNKMALSLVAILAITANSYADEQSTKLNDVTVTSKSLGYSDVDSSKFINHQANLLSEALRDIPGVYVGGTNGFNQKLYMRGVNDRAINITIDGAKQKGNTFHHNADLLLDPELLKAANIDVGVNSVSQGAGALGGSVAFKTIDASDMLENGENFGGKIKTGYGSNNSDWSQSLTLYGKAFDRLELLGYVSNHSHDFGESGDGYRVGGDGDDLSTLLKATFKITDKQKLSISYNKMKYSGLYPYKPEFGSMPAKNKKGEYEIQKLIDQEYVRDTYVFDYTVNQNEYLNLGLNAYYTKHELSRDTWATDVSTKGVLLNNKSYINFANLANTFNYGIEYYKTTNNRNNFNKKPSAKGDEATSLTLFLEDKIKWGNLSITPGIKYDKATLESMGGSGINSRAKNKFDEFSSSLTAEYKFDFGLGFFAGYTELFRAPDVIEAIRLDGYDTFKSSPDLKPETGSNKEIGITYNTNISDNASIKLMAKYFKTDYENLIVEYAKPGSTANVQRSNAGEATTDGIELLASLYMYDFSLSASFSKADTEYTSLNNTVSKGKTQYGDIVGRDSGDKYTLNAEYYLDNIDVSFGWNSLFVDKLKTEVETKKSYAVHDIYASWQPSKKLKGLHVNLGIYNIFDKEYVSHTSRSTTANNRDSEPGRNIKATISYKF